MVLLYVLAMLLGKVGHIIDFPLPRLPLLIRACSNTQGALHDHMMQA